jgi:hypothetical protein
MANGERAVEDLAIGDLVVTAHRGLQPVQAIKRFPHNRAVRVACSALADDVPYSDLYVTEEHALLIDGLFVTAGSLVNGTTIDYANEQSAYFHIELPIYDAVYAAGVPVRELHRAADGNGIAQQSPAHGVTSTQCGRALVGYPPPG